MCSDPQQYVNKLTGTVTTGACRTCDGCIAARRAGWVARCMAENTQWKHAVCVSLTYDDKAPGGYDAARFFAYHDVRSLVHRITAALRRVDKSLCVRFICAGEQGDRNGRCHWHLILWSDYDLRRLGTVKFCSADRPVIVDGQQIKPGDVITDPEAMMSVGKDKRRLHWALWARDKIPLGFITFGAADEAGAKYVVSYCLKDQFTVEKSKGKARHDRSENFATGLFRQSKRPAIGEAWLWQKLQDLADTSAVLPNTHLVVPGLQPGRYWYPSGPMRAKLLWGLRAINQMRVWSGLGDAPQWAGLLNACKDNPSDLEMLLGPQTEQKQSFSEVFRAKEIDGAFKARDALARFNAGWRVLCYVCLINSESAELHGQGIGSWQEQDGLVFYDQASGRRALSGEGIRARGGKGCSCEACGRKDYLRAFPRARKAPDGAANVQAAS